MLLLVCFFGGDLSGFSADIVQVAGHQPVQLLCLVREFF